MKNTFSRTLLLFLAFFSSLAVVPVASCAEDDSRVIYKIGVLANKDKLEALRAWFATGRYLSSVMPDTQFMVIPFSYEEIEAAVNNKEVDFLIVNPAIYVDLEMRYNVQRIATLKRRGLEWGQTVLGGVLFTRAEEGGLEALNDLKGKRIKANHPSAFDGWLTVLREFKELKIEPAKYFQSVEFNGDEESIVRTVLNKECDAGIVRTGILEEMAKQGKIELQQIKVIPLSDYHFCEPCPYLHSTRLYPEWPFVKLEHTPLELAEVVLKALLNIKPDDLSAVLGNYSGWTVPLIYTPVHDCLRELHWGPYKDYGKVTIKSVITHYWPWLLAIILSLIAVSTALVVVSLLNKKISDSRAQLQEKEHAYRTLTSNLTCIVYRLFVRENNRMQFFNEMVQPMTGYSLAEFSTPGKLAFDSIMLPEDRKDTLEKIRQAVRKDLPFEVEYRIRRKDGQLRYFLERGRGIKEDDGKLLFIDGVIFDITEKKISQIDLQQAYEQLKAAQAQVVQSAKMASIGLLAGGVAHEINNPLTGVLNNIQLIKMIAEQKKDFSYAELKEYLDAVEHSAGRCRDITRTLLEFSHASKDTFELISINTTVESVVKLVSRELELQNIEVRFGPADNLPWVRGNPQLLQQAVFNLVSNAAWAIKKRGADATGAITLRTFEKEGERRVCLTVADTGIGIAKENLNNLFVPFFTTKEIGEGTGLGLSIVYNIIKEYKGTITVDSVKGQGTVFTICLPFADSVSG